MGLFSKIVSKIYKTNNNKSNPINEVLFYGTNDDKKTIETGTNNLFCIYYVIIQASISVDVCVPSLASDTIAKCLIAAKQKNNVKVRVTIHKSSDFCNLQSFSQNGIEVKLINSTERFEHEFILIDAGTKDALAIIGSLEYETNRVNCNRDATILTSEVTVMKALMTEFDRIWDILE